MSGPRLRALGGSCRPNVRAGGSESGPESVLVSNSGEEMKAPEREGMRRSGRDRMGTERAAEMHHDAGYWLDWVELIHQLAGPLTWSACFQASSSPESKLDERPDGQAGRELELFQWEKKKCETESEGQARSLQDQEVGVAKSKLRSFQAPPLHLRAFCHAPNWPSYLLRAASSKLLSRTPTQYAQSPVWHVRVPRISGLSRIKEVAIPNASPSLALW